MLAFVLAMAMSAPGDVIVRQTKSVDILLATYACLEQCAIDAGAHPGLLGTAFVVNASRDVAETGAVIYTSGVRYTEEVTKDSTNIKPGTECRGVGPGGGIEVDKIGIAEITEAQFRCFGTCLAAAGVLTVNADDAIGINAVKDQASGNTSVSLSFDIPVTPSDANLPPGTECRGVDS